MADEADPRLKNPYAIPVAALVGDGGVAHEQLVTVQPHQQHTEWVPSGSADGNADCDGD